MAHPSAPLWRIAIWGAPVTLAVVVFFALSHTELTKSGTALLIGVAVGVADYFLLRFIFEKVGLF